MATPLASLHVSSSGPASERAATGTSLAPIRNQAAVVHAMLDELERMVPAPAANAPVRAQLVEELTRLACTMIEAAAAMAREIDAAEASGLRPIPDLQRT